MNRRLLAAVTLGILSACATVQTSLPLPIEVSLQLAKVDGQPVGKRSFRFELQNDHSYVATFNCGEHFGTYTYRETLILKAGASTATTCDQIDISTGRRIVYDPGLANEFFADPNFNVLSSRGFVELRNSRRTFRFVASH